MGDVAEIFKSFSWYEILMVFFCLFVYEILKYYAKKIVDWLNERKSEKFALEREDKRFKNECVKDLQTTVADLLFQEKVRSVKNMYEYVSEIGGQSAFIKMLCALDLQRFVFSKVDEIDRMGIQKIVCKIDNSVNSNNCINIVGRKQCKSDRLFIDDDVLKYVDLCEEIFCEAVLVLSALKCGTCGMLQHLDKLDKDIIRLVPASKSGFDKYGHFYAYYWLDYFIDCAKNELKREMGIKNIALNNQIMIESVLNMANKTENEKNKRSV